jgi:acetone carboxylase gamma subunit
VKEAYMILLLTTREKLKELDDNLEDRGQSYREYLVPHGELEPPPPAPGEILYICPHCEGIRISVCVRTWFPANVSENVPSEAVLEEIDWEGAREYHCNDCGKTISPNKTTMPPFEKEDDDELDEDY